MAETQHVVFFFFSLNPLFIQFAAINHSVITQTSTFKPTNLFLTHTNTQINTHAQ